MAPAGGLMFVLTLVHLVLCTCTARFRELTAERKNPAENEPGGVLQTEN